MVLRRKVLRKEVTALESDAFAFVYVSLLASVLSLHMTICLSVLFLWMRKKSNLLRVLFQE